MVAWFQDSDPLRGTGNAFPWGSNGVRYQAVVPGALLGGAPVIVNDVLVAGHASSMEVVYDDIEIRMGMTAQSSPAASWAANDPNPIVVWRGPLRVVFEVGAWRGIGLPHPFRFVPTAAAPNLCFEVIVWATQHPGVNFYSALAGSTASPGGAIARAFSFQWTQNQAAPPTVLPDGGNKMGLLLGSGNFVGVGSGCPGSSSNVPTIAAAAFPRAGMQFDVLLHGGMPASAAALCIGASFTHWGPVPLPVDLAPIGAPGCWLWNDPLLLLPCPVDAAGDGRITLPVPAVTQFGRAYATWVTLDLGANALGLTTSGLGTLLLGN